MYLTSVDNFLILAYAIVLLGIGALFSLKAKDPDDYFFGRFSLPPTLVGVSLFASFLSAISYLTIPGETVQFGPIALGLVIGNALACWGLTRAVVPRVMRVQLQTVYELLERKYSRTERLLASSVFLVLRLLWMGLVIYTTVWYVLVPVLGWSSADALPLSLYMAGITIVYTALGGIRAVVYTDAIQAAILLGGALLALALITSELGGIAAWWPTVWHPHWQPLTFTISFTSARNIYAAVLSGFVWTWCTYASDQVAVQRYTVTGGVTQARRMLIISVALSITITVLLSLLGLALLAFFQSPAHVLAPQQSIAPEADRLFSLYIAREFPAGISGLMIAALLSAAMSSLSSGINSSCSVLIFDFFPHYWLRFGNIRRALFFVAVSFLIGLVAVGISMFIHSLEGNLFEIGLKVTNCLVAPLYILIHMTWFTGIASRRCFYAVFLSCLAVSILLSFENPFGISILWAMPLSLIIGVTCAYIGDLATQSRAVIAK